MAKDRLNLSFDYANFKEGDPSSILSKTWRSGPQAIERVFLQQKIYELRSTGSISLVKR